MAAICDGVICTKKGCERHRKGAQYCMDCRRSVRKRGPATIRGSEQQFIAVDDGDFAPPRDDDDEDSACSDVGAAAGTRQSTRATKKPRRFARDESRASRDESDEDWSP